MTRVMRSLSNGLRFCALGVLALVSVFFAEVCLAQASITGNVYLNNTGDPAHPEFAQLLSSSESLTVSPGGTYNFTIWLTSGPGFFLSQPAVDGQFPTSVSVYQWPLYDTGNYSVTDPDTNITLSNLQFVDGTHASFTVSVANETPKGVDQIQVIGEWIKFVWPLNIQPASPPNQPSPPQAPNCSARPSITSVTPDTWLAGQTYPVTIVGTNFVTSAMAVANSNCAANQLTVDVPTGTIDLSEVNVVDSTRITAKVKSDKNDPSETATLTLWGAGGVTLLGAQARTSIGSMTKSLTTLSVNSGPPPGMNQVATANAKVATGKLCVMNPYAVLPQGATSISESYLASSFSNCRSLQAKGLITDGSATAIAVYQIAVNKRVTFRGTSGLQFETWNPSFLTYPPSHGNCGGDCSIPVDPQFKGNDGNYYAFALVVAPQQSGSTSYGFQVSSVTASVETDSGEVSSKPTYIDIGPTPVILVHGLWGDGKSLQTQQSNIGFTSPWYMYRGIFNGAVSSVCYANSIPFDASGDLTTGSGCLQSSADAITTQISDVQNTLEGMAYVGGRVDIVAHSMGGLATRHYTATPDYTTLQNNNRSRTLGPLRTIVTVDTPETGSPLATALLTKGISGGTCALASRSTDDASLYTCDFGLSSGRAARTWVAACHSDNHTTLAQCLANNQMPLGPPNAPFSVPPSPCEQENQPATGATCGAVASLAPGSPNIRSLPLINNIQNRNVSWFAIESDWQDSGGDSPSLMRAFFDDLLGAMKLNSQLPKGLCPALNNPIPSPPTLLCMMADPDNDVIVPTRSQSDDTSSNLVEFFGRAHSPMPPKAAFRYLLEKSNANILDGVADPCIEQILLKSSTQGCEPATPQVRSEATAGRLNFDDGQSVVAGVPGEKLEDARERHNYPMRIGAQIITIEQPQGDVFIGSPLRLVLHLSPGKVNSILYEESVGSEVLDAGDNGLARVLNDNGDAKTIEVFPLELGPMEISINAIYSDNSTAEQTVHVNVVPSSKGLKWFDLNQGFHSITLKIGDDIVAGSRRLVPLVGYSNTKFSIHLRDTSQVRLSIQQDPTAPVISVSAEGIVQALRPGTAIITGAYCGVSDELVVKVEAR